MVLSSVLSGIGFGVGLGATYSTVVDLLRTATTWVKWRALGGTLGYQKITEALQTIASAEKDEVSGLTPRGMVDVIYQFMNHTMDMAVFISESVATQMFVQMIQQSIAYAIHASHAGAIGTVMNVYSGGTYLSSTEVSSVGENVDLVDRHSRGFLSAEAGQNIPTLAYSLSRGVNRRIEDVYRSIMRSVDSLLDEWNDMALSYYRQFHTMARTRFGDAIEMKESIVTRAYGLLEQIANEHLARISEQLDTLEGAKAWFDAGLMESSELADIAVRIDLEREASEDNYDEHKTAILNSIEAGVAEWDSKIEQALNDLKSSEDAFNVLIYKIFSTVFADVVDFVSVVCSMVDKTVEDVCAYRNVKKAVAVKPVEGLGIEEFSSESDVFRLRWRKWQQVPPIKVVYEYQVPRALHWSEVG